MQHESSCKSCQRLPNAIQPTSAAKQGSHCLLAPSIKAGLDFDWSDPKQKAMAIGVLERRISSLQRWVDRHFGVMLERAPGMAYYVVWFNNVLPDGSEV